MTGPTLLVIAKQPQPGRVKTRLIGPCTPEQAAALAAAALADTLATLDAVPAADKVLLLAGTLPPRPGWRIVTQSGGGLDQRLAAGFEAVTGPALLVGMDTPQLRPEQLAFDAGQFDACLGPAADGGYWAIGFADPARARECIVGVPMSQDHTGAEQLRRLQRAGLRVQLLPELVDVDTADSARAVAAAAPATRFARLWREIDTIPDPVRR